MKESLAAWTQGEMESLIRSLARYTRFVRSTKVLLGIVAALLTGVLLFYPLTRNEDAGVRIAFTSIEKGAASPTQMLNARFHGLDQKNQPFDLTARTATQRDPDTLDLADLSGAIGLAGGIWLSVSAKRGVFHMKARGLDLTGAIDMFDDGGYELRTETLHVDIARKNAETQAEVRGQGPLGTLKARGAVVNGGLGSIVFGGPVLMTIYPAGEPGGVK